MKLTKQQYNNLVHNCALVYNAVPIDVYMKFHRNVNKTISTALIRKMDNASQVLCIAFVWCVTNKKTEGYKFWDGVNKILKLKANEGEL